MAAEGESGTWLVFQTRWCLFVFTFWLVKTPVFVILHLAVSPFLCRYGFILLHWLSSLVSAFLLEMVVYLAFPMNSMKLVIPLHLIVLVNSHQR